MDPLPLPNERGDFPLRPVEGCNQAVFEQILAVVRLALAAASPPSDVPFEEVPDGGPKPGINIARILSRADHDLTASENLVEERARLGEQPGAKASISQWIARSEDSTKAKVQKLLALGVRPEVVVEVMAGLLAGTE